MIKLEHSTGLDGGDRISHCLKSVDFMAALDALCISALSLGAGIVDCRPTRVETRYLGDSVRTILVLEGEEEPMRRLYAAARTVADRSCRISEQARRDFEGYQTVDGLAGVFGLFASARAREIAGDKLAVEALLVASETTEPAHAAIAKELGAIGFFVLLTLRLVREPPLADTSLETAVQALVAALPYGLGCADLPDLFADAATQGGLIEQAAQRLIELRRTAARRLAEQRRYAASWRGRIHGTLVRVGDTVRSLVRAA